MRLSNVNNAKLFHNRHPEKQKAEEHQKQEERERHEVNVRQMCFRLEGHQLVI